MPLPTFATLEEIPEVFRAEYVERDGAFVPNIEDVSALKNAHERQKEEARLAKARLKELEDANKARSAGITDEQLAAMRAEIAAEYAPTAEKLTAAEKELRSIKLDGRIEAMMLAAGVNPKRVGDLRKLIGDRFDLNGSGSPMLTEKPTTDLAKYFAEVVAAEYPEFYPSTLKAGPRFPGDGGTPSTATDDTLPPAARLEALFAKK